MPHKLNRHVFIRETGIVIQPNLYWLAASPDGLVKDSNNNPNIGMLEIKCPKSKRNSTPQELLGDQSFYILAFMMVTVFKENPWEWILHANTDGYGTSTCNVL